MFQRPKVAIGVRNSRFCVILFTKLRVVQQPTSRNSHHLTCLASLALVRVLPKVFKDSCRAVGMVMLLLEEQLRELLQVASMTLRTRYTTRAFGGLPDFLVPGLFTRPRCKAFSTTTSSKSRIGSAPLSIPQEVNLILTEPPAPAQSTVTRTEPTKTLQIEGPLGR